MDIFWVCGGAAFYFEEGSQNVTSEETNQALLWELGRSIVLLESWQFEQSLSPSLGWKRVPSEFVEPFYVAMAEN